ncbi:MmcQ/YjbR family DNA-binding protein [Vibrio diazotrophicus]|uniref:DNA-binding protein (MmcQ/YjbR family) n=2 Tax=Vibrio diazotrophicus TaxID=685 RepID=A0A2J8I8R7_VIBDI|nr:MULTISPECIES: MmcQ/YjbR family DNA-binding protein [Vibrio]MCF7362162.1 MmcQ/YjbR family DNA-binding protein [Vibrio sp. A1-b2]MCZ4370404.1 MmcQ/YjbR family DNA-binding protein [Vibrio diazotrophicus]PNH93647.1 hypothetical protein C1M59_06600 [Vibrio diazotrophicus]PNI06937.1 hypothetical protein C1N32_01475 [Vibrio diazotrophicus]
MDIRQLEEYLNNLPQAEASNPFGPDPLVFKIRDKMFAYLAFDTEKPFVTLKCEPQDGAFLTDQFDAIKPGYHMNKRHWISVILDGDVEPEMIEDLCLRSFRLVVSKLKKSDREALQLLMP